MRMILWLLYILVFFYNILDIYQTWMLLQLGASEANPLIYFLLRVGGWPFVLIIKVGVCLGLGVLLFFYLRKTDR